MIPKFEDYPLEIRPLTADEGGGFLATFPDLPGCMADGESPEEAIEDARGAFAAWMAAHVEDGRPVPVPGGDVAPVRFVQRLPRSVHSALKALAASDGVSMNTMATVLIAEGIGARSHA
ncbi:MAG: type II toxin-antitoxin system HicB family antitoxin [Rhodocyclaceae bacterium]|nr:type II toxin-antitoxin system HicB family antitoxin [Rhodocyclaceae bacterium]